jgi:hypothetical protein
MTPRDDRSAKFAPDHPQRMVIVAYTRLFLLPERTDGSKLTTIASIGGYDIRLIELPIGLTPLHIHPLWVELRNAETGQVLDSAGCRDLPDAAVATDSFISEARSLIALGSPSATMREDPLT